MPSLLPALPVVSSGQFRDAVLRKCQESSEIKATFFEANAGRIEQMCGKLATALSAGRRLFIIGNGGSACDAMHAAFEFVHPVVEKRCAFPAFALVNDAVLIPPISNDSDMGNGGSRRGMAHAALEYPIAGKRRVSPAFALVNDTILLTDVRKDSGSDSFAQQLRSFGRDGDAVLAISTSGMSMNVNRGLQAAREIGMLTIALTGQDGSRTEEIAEYCLTVPSFRIHRIQEVHTTLLHVLWDMVHVLLGEEDII